MADMQDKEEAAAIAELKAMSREELDLVDHDTVKWGCQCKGCNNGTRVRDYGISPRFYRPAGKSGQWVNLNLHSWLCGKHMKFYRRLVKSFDIAKVQERLMDRTQKPLEKLSDRKKGKLPDIQ